MEAGGLRGRGPAGGAGAGGARSGPGPAGPAGPAPAPARDWAGGLPRDLLEAVARAVPAGDRLFFRLVCRSWAAAGARVAPAEGERPLPQGKVTRTRMADLRGRDLCGSNPYAPYGSNPYYTAATRGVPR